MCATQSGTARVVTMKTNVVSKPIFLPLSAAPRDISGQKMSSRRIHGISLCDYKKQNSLVAMGVFFFLMNKLFFYNEIWAKFKMAAMKSQK